MPIRSNTILLTLFLSFFLFQQAQGAPFAYIPNINSNNVSVIDTATNKVVDTIPVYEIEYCL